MLQIKPELLTEALPHVAMFMKHGLRSERDLIGSMEFLAKMKGISSHAAEEAKETMRKNVLSFAIKESTLGGIRVTALHILL
ncbi:MULTISPECIES: hypothetical protein [unclassified Bartonella]|uniref:hypothetical protein n=1 Tax=unclassified Bartonella TaxID=2645622 RepID=UPI0035CE903D